MSISSRDIDEENLDDLQNSKCIENYDESDILNCNFLNLVV